MTRTRTRPVVVLLVAALMAALGFALLSVKTPAAGAATVTACVKKRSGAVRIRSGKAAKRRCPKGWKRVRWNTSGKRGKRGKTGKPGAQGVAGVPGVPGVAGVQGLAGPPGPALSVKDKDGAVLGQFMGLVPSGFPIFLVQREGGFFYYYPSGQLLGIGSPSWKTSNCQGTAYLEAGSAFEVQVFAALVGGPFRTVYRSSAGALGAPSAWKMGGVAEALVNVQLYRRNSSGVCETDGPPSSSTIVSLEQITPPPDVPGPLTVG